MKTKKVMINHLFIIFLIISLFLFPSYGDELRTQQETPIAQENEIENMSLGELMEEIKNLDKDDIENIKKEVDKIELEKKVIKAEKISLRDKIKDMVIAIFIWLKEQIYSLRYSIIVLLILYAILKYIRHKKKGGGNQWEELGKERPDNYT